MTTPIINPTTLTEEQREGIRAEYIRAKESEEKWEGFFGPEGHDDWYDYGSCFGKRIILERLFGENFFEKGE